MAMSICESLQSTALAGLGIRPPHWAALQFLKPREAHRFTCPHSYAKRLSHPP